VKGGAQGEIFRDAQSTQTWGKRERAASGMEGISRTYWVLERSVGSFGTNKRLGA